MPKRRRCCRRQGRYSEALVLRERLAKDDPGLHTLGALASLLAEMDRWVAAETSYAAALDADNGVSPLPVLPTAVRVGRERDAPRRSGPRGSDLAELDAILPAHVPGRGHRAEVALARGQLDRAMALIMPLLEISTIRNIARFMRRSWPRGDRKARGEAERAAAAYELLLARRPEAFADHAAAFFMGVGNQPQRAVERRGQLEAPRHAALAQPSGQGTA